MESPDGTAQGLAELEVLQYDPLGPGPLEDEDDDDFFTQRMRAGPSRERQGSITIDERDKFAGDVLLDETDLRQVENLARDELAKNGAKSPIRRGRSILLSSDDDLKSLSSAAIRDRRPADRQRKPSPSSPRQWDQTDSWVAPPSKLDRRWDQADSWVDEEMLKEVEVEEKLARSVRAPTQSQRVAARMDDLLVAGDDRSNQANNADIMHRGMRGWGEPGDADERNTMNGIDKVPVVTVESVRQAVALRIFGTGSAIDEPVPVETHRAPTHNDNLSEEEEAILDAQLWGTEDAIDLDLLAEKKDKYIASEVASKPSATMPTPRQDAATSQARQAIIDNAKRRAEKKEQLLAKLVRAKMQSRQRPRGASPEVHYRDDESYASDAPESEGAAVYAQPAPASPDLTEDLTPTADAIEAEARARAKAKLRMRLLQEKKRQQQPVPIPAITQIAPAVQATQMEQTAQDRTAMLRERLLKARQQKQAVSTT